MFFAKIGSIFEIQTYCENWVYLIFFFQKLGLF